MAFVPAKCTQCGADITIDESKEAGICEHCNTAFITEKAVNNYITNVTNHNQFIGATINVRERQDSSPRDTVSSPKVLHQDTLKEVDVHSPVDILKYAIVSDAENNFYTRITFENGSQGVIDSLKISIAGSNKFNEAIPVHGDTAFMVILQELGVRKRKKYQTGYIPLPDSQMRRLKLSISQIRFEDGTILENSPHFVTPHYHEVTDRTIFDFAKSMSSVFECYPSEEGDNWICSCRKVNPSGYDKCYYCLERKEDIFEAYNESALKKDYAEYLRKQEETELEFRELKRQAALEKRRRLIRYSVIAIICIAVLIGISVVAGT